MARHAHFPSRVLERQFILERLRSMLLSSLSVGQSFFYLLFMIGRGPADCPPLILSVRNRTPSNPTAVLLLNCFCRIKNSYDNRPLFRPVDSSETQLRSSLPYLSGGKTALNILVAQ
jgi:hypothetical protein